MRTAYPAARFIPVGFIPVGNVDEAGCRLAGLEMIACSGPSTSLAPRHSGEHAPPHASLAPSERRLSPRAPNPSSHPGQLVFGDILSGVTLPANAAVPVLVAQERVGPVSQTVGTPASRLGRT
jgi:hypothetical protein